MAWVAHVSNESGSMTQSEMEQNATEIYNQLRGYGWTLNAICAVLGNMQQESYLNPAQWQIGYDIGSQSAGYGLVQFTPSTKYTNWANEQGYDITDGEHQVYAIDTQPWGTEYIPTSDFPLSYSEFKVSDKDLDYLTEAFLRNYERAGVSALESRQQYANDWYKFLSGEEPPTPDPPEPTPTKKKKSMPLYFYPCVRYC